MSSSAAGASMAEVIDAVDIVGARSNLGAVASYSQTPRISHGLKTLHKSPRIMQYRARLWRHLNAFIRQRVRPERAHSPHTAQYYVGC